MRGAHVVREEAVDGVLQAGERGVEVGRADALHVLYQQLQLLPVRPQLHLARHSGALAGCQPCRRAEQDRRRSVSAPSPPRRKPGGAAAGGWPRAGPARGLRWWQPQLPALPNRAAAALMAGSEGRGRHRRSAARASVRSAAWRPPPRGRGGGGGSGAGERGGGGGMGAGAAERCSLGRRRAPSGRAPDPLGRSPGVCSRGTHGSLPPVSTGAFHRYPMEPSTGASTGAFQRYPRECVPVVPPGAFHRYPRECVPEVPPGVCSRGTPGSVFQRHPRFKHAFQWSTRSRPELPQSTPVVHT